jgi:hypothetical protein
MRAGTASPSVGDGLGTGEEVAVLDGTLCGVTPGEALGSAGVGVRFAQAASPHITSRIKAVRPGQVQRTYFTSSQAYWREFVVVKVLLSGYLGMLARA